MGVPVNPTNVACGKASRSTFAYGLDNTALICSSLLAANSISSSFGLLNLIRLALSNWVRCASSLKQMMLERLLMSPTGSSSRSQNFCIVQI